MATYNGARYIDEQLRSLQTQTHTDWALWIGDDGSSDGTLQKIQAFQAANPDKDIRVLDGPKMGATANFLALLTHHELPDGPVAFCDQDDIWLPHKISTALQSLAGKKGACAYSCTDIPVNDQGITVGRPKQRKPASFGNALVQNVMRGNSIVLNADAVTRLRASTKAALANTTIPFHDWWVYLTITATGGTVVLDPNPGLYYRQHGQNVLGANVGLRAKLRRAKLIASGEFAKWITCNVRAMSAVTDMLHPQSAATLQQFIALRKTWGLSAVVQLWRSPVRLQGKVGSILVAVLTCLGRL